MAPAVKGDPQWDEDFKALVDKLHTEFHRGWRQMDYETSVYTVNAILSVLPKLFQISHMRGKQGHGRK